MNPDIGLVINYYSRIVSTRQKTIISSTILVGMYEDVCMSHQQEFQ